MAAQGVMDHYAVHALPAAMNAKSTRVTRSNAASAAVAAAAESMLQLQHNIIDAEKIVAQINNGNVWVLVVGWIWIDLEMRNSFYVFFLFWNNFVQLWVANFHYDFNFRYRCPPSTENC